MIKTIVTPEGCKNVEMTQQEISARQTEINEYEAKRAADALKPPKKTIEERLTALEQEIIKLKGV